MAVTGTFIGDFSSFQAAVDASQVKIRQFESDSSKVETTLDRVANSFSGRKIIQEATLMAAAIEKGGGEARLTSAELERAGKVAAEAAEKMKALGIQVPANIEKLSKAAHEGGGFLSELQQHVVATATGMFTAEAAIDGVNKVIEIGTDFVKDSVAAYAAEELALKRVNTALKVQGDLRPEVIEQYKELSQEIQRNSVFSHTAASETEALLIQVGDVGPKKMKAALDAVTNLASGLGIDLHAATLLVGKAFEGNTTTLGRYGVVLDQARIKSEGIDYVLSAIQDKFGGQAAAEVETYSGKIKQLGNDWEDLKESVGRAIVEDPELQAFLKNAQEGIRGTSEEAKNAKPTITEYWAALLAPSSAGLVTIFNAIQQNFADIDAQIKHLAPPPPKMFEGFTNDIDAADKRMQEFAKETVAGWEYEEKTRDAMEKKREKEETERNKKFMDEQAEFSKLIAESNKLRVEQGGTAREIEIANIRAVEAAEIESLTRRGQANAANLALIHENADRAIKGLGLDWKMLQEQSLDTARQQRDDALETYQYMLVHADQYTREALDKQLEKYRELATAATAMGRAAVDAQDSAAAAAKRHNEELDKQKKKEEEAAAAAKKNREQSFSTNITAANFDQYVPPHGIQKSSVLALLQQGFSLENAIAILQAQARGATVDLSKWPEDARGPRVPGFRTGVERFAGGLAVVGEDEPELVDLPAGARVTPFSRLRSVAQGDSSGEREARSVTIVNVSGVFDPRSERQLGKVVSDAQYRQFLVSRRH